MLTLSQTTLPFQHLQMQLIACSTVCKFLPQIFPNRFLLQVLKTFSRVLHMIHVGVGASVPPGVPEVLWGPFPVYQCHPVVRSSSRLAIHCCSGLLPSAAL